MLQASAIDQERRAANSIPVNRPTIQPSRVGTSAFTLEQELEPFAKWHGDSIWVPPKESSKEFAEFALRHHGLFSSKDNCWNTIQAEFQNSFQHVREIELYKASIRLPRGRLFVSVTDQANFDRITDRIPACVQTRLEEFLARYGSQPGVKVSYLKPLCVEVNDQLIFTGRDEIMQAIDLIKSEVFSEYRRLYLAHRPILHLRRAANACLAVPKKVLEVVHERRQRVIDAYQARLEFERRKLALRAAKTHRKCRTDGCTFDEMLSLTNPLIREDVVDQYCLEKKLSQAERDRILKGGLLTMPWFVALSVGLSYLPSLTITVAPPLVVCDPAFVAEFPHRKGVLLKIGHFDEIGGVPHVEL